MLIVVFTVLIGSLFAITLAVHRTSAEIDALCDNIVAKSTPSIEYLAALRGATVEVELALSRYIRDEDGPRAADEATVNRALREVSDAVHRYLALPEFPDEARYQDRMQESWARFDESAARTKDLVERGKIAEASEHLTRVVEPSASQVIDAAMGAIELNAQHERVLASRIRQIRDQTVWLASSMSAGSVALCIAGALLLHRQARSRRDAEQAHAKFLEERAAELEQFAGRVAHDISNPLSSALMGAELLLMHSPRDNPDEIAQRIIRSLRRANAITTALLDFARSGARPDPGARTSLHEALTDVHAAFTPDAERAHIDLRIEPIPPVLVACSEGVYLSLVGNLIRNALKYMGDSTTRQVTVRVLERASHVRTEVSDTGPGIAVEDLNALFEPYFRAGRSGRDGLGLGLATVKRLAEGHQGRVGASSVFGSGSTFWFELPRAGSAWDLPANEDTSGEYPREAQAAK